jgi:tetratricopeptide (TPR) repeat protein
VASSDKGQAAASGKLRDRPVPRLIQQVFRRRVTGSMVVTDDSGDVTRVYLRDGLPVHVVRPTDIDRLDRILIGNGLVSSDAIAAADDEVVRTGRRLGEVLVARGVISKTALAEVLKTQMRRKVTRLFFARQGTFEIFVESHQYGEGDELQLMRVDPRSILYPGIRAAYDDERLRHELMPLAGYAFRLVTTVPPTFVEAMGFSATDHTLAALRQRALKLEDLPVPGSKPVESRAVTLALLYSDLLDATASQSRAPAPAPANDPLSGPVVAETDRRTTWTAIPVLGSQINVAAIAAPPPIPAAVRPSSGPVTPRVSPAIALSMAGTGGNTADGLRAAILELHHKLDHSSHFEILGVPENASNAEVNAAYMRAVRQYHPDRLAAAGLRDLTPQAERVMGRMGEASAVLRDSKQRAEYVAQRSGKKEGPAALSILEAEKCFQKGEALLNKGDYARAMEGFAEAVKINPAEAQYRAYLAWARFDDPRGRKELVARESLSVIQQAVVEQPRFARGFFWIGQIWKYLNDPVQAEKAFREASSADKGFLEAEREVRLLEMRRSKSAQSRPAASPASARQQGGLFGKFLKRDDD